LKVEQLRRLEKLRDDIGRVVEANFDTIKSLEEQQRTVILKPEDMVLGKDGKPEASLRSIIRSVMAVNNNSPMPASETREAIIKSFPCFSPDTIDWQVSINNRERIE
jgi:hypothetical protein